MADFCNQCADDLRLPRGDLKGLCEQGYKVGVICEDCGITWVDHNGDCVCVDCDKRHSGPYHNERGGGFYHGWRSFLLQRRSGISLNIRQTSSPAH